MIVWEPIEDAPKDGREVYVKREFEGRIVKEGWAVWGVNAADAPMRAWGDGGLSGPIPPDNAYADTPRWLTPDRQYSFPTPTHWTASPPQSNSESPNRTLRNSASARNTKGR